MTTMTLNTDCVIAINTSPDEHGVYLSPMLYVRDLYVASPRDVSEVILYELTAGDTIILLGESSEDFECYCFKLNDGNILEIFMGYEGAFTEVFVEKDVFTASLIHGIID